MLVLTRRPGEKIEITFAGDTFLSVEVLEVKGGAVRLGFKSPPRVVIDRAEVAARKRLEAGRNGERKP